MTVVTDTELAAAIDQSGRGNPFRFVQPHNAAFWLYVALFPIGVLYFLALIDDSARAFPSAFVLAAVLWILYLIPWVLFIRHEDMYDPEPAKLALVGFLWGGFVAAWVMAYEANTAITSLVGKLGSPELARDWGPSIAAPFVEETAKGLGVVILVLLGRRHVRSTFDGALLGAFVGLGFQVLEDFFYSINAAVAAGPGNETQAVFGQFIFRGFLAGLWDSPFVNGTTASAVTLPAKFVVYPLVFVFAIRWVVRQRREDLGVILARDVANGTLTTDDVELLVMSRHERRKGLRHLKHQDGKAARTEERHRLRGARDLATALAKSNGAESDDVIDARRALITTDSESASAPSSQ
jgi:RsiW-degrading membrane proteinase PrsW (M82 family)